MPQSLSAVYVHIVFSILDRRPFLQEPVLLAEMHAYLGGTSDKLGCQPLLIGGVADHVHILARQGRTIALSDWVGKLKSSSSGWIKERQPSLTRFAWQAGYGAFSVGVAEVEHVRQYIRGQEEHHRTWSFQDEFRKLLQESGMDWNEKHVWD